MSKILVVGPAPYWALPDNVAISAKNHRAWQLLQPLLADGHHVCVLTDDPVRLESQCLPASLIIRTLNIRHVGWRGLARRICINFQPDAILAIMWRGALLSLFLPQDIPLWADIYGYSAGEIQLALGKYGSDRGLLSSIAFHRRILNRIDAVSACSNSQANAVVGELGIVGRLNQHTVGYRFVSHIPPSVAEPPGFGREPQMPNQTVADGAKQDSIVRLLYYGGYNAWTDVDTLFEGVSIAMERCPNLEFVSVGGEIKGVDAFSYGKLLERVACSPFSKRVRMLGWLPYIQARNELQRADFGLSIDSWSYETLLGTRTRLVDMMAHGIPVITTLACDLSEVIRDHMAGLVFPIGDFAALGSTIAQLYQDESLREQLAINGKRLIETDLSPSLTTVPLREWVKSPHPAPDRIPGSCTKGFQKLELVVRAWAKLALWDTLGWL